MNYYVSSKPNDPFVSFFSTQGGTRVKTVMLHNFEEKVLAKQISKLTPAGSDVTIAFSSELTKKILNTPGLIDRLSNNLETDYSIAIEAENAGSYLHLYAVRI